MAIFTRDKIATYAIEVLVVVLGILIAFQVEEWRDDRQLSRDRDAALTRLAEETAANLEICRRIVPRFADNARWVMALVKSLNAGVLEETDVASFEAGLIRVGYIQGSPYSVTVAEEMIATGLLKALDDANLRDRIGEMPVWVEDARAWHYDTRGSLRMAVAEVASAVTFGYQGEWPVLEDDEEFVEPDFEQGISVDYVFEDLVANTTLKNLLLEAADTHVDMWIHHRALCERFAELKTSLDAR